MSLIDFWWDVFDGYTIGPRETPAGVAACLILPVHYLPSRAQDTTQLRHGYEDSPPRTASRRYAPLQSESALFRNFAEVRTADDVLAFARQYGHLGREFFTRRESDEMEGVNEYVDPCEPIGLWLRESQSLRSTLEAASLAQKQDDAGLRRLARANPLGQERITFDASDPEDDSEWAVKPTWVAAGRDLVRAAATFVSLNVNRYLQHASPRMLMDTQGTKPALHLRLVPESLLEAIWLQYAETIGTQRVFVQCARGGCQKWFELAPQAKRRTAVYCGSACRNRAHRDRKAKGSLS